MKARETDLRTRDGLAIYDLCPQGGELWAVAGPSGIDPEMIDHESLPDGFRFVTGEDGGWGDWTA